MRKKSLILSIVLLAGCQQVKDWIPDPLILVGQETLLTTQTLEAEVILNPDQDIPSGQFLIRWDWEGDGTFDVPYSQSQSASHRYFNPGNYTLTVEVLGLKGQTYTSTQSIVVQQGFSKPVPRFKISPETGNPKTQFHFDASATHDDEESLENLIFSWDFNGDQTSDLIRKGNPSASHQFEEARSYRINLVVTDTSGLSALVWQTLEVTMIDTLIIPVVAFSPEFPTDRDTIIFDASESYYQDDPDKSLQFSFKPHNGSWTEPGDTATFHWGRPLNGYNTLSVKVLTSDGYYKIQEKKFQVTTGDRPPTATFKRSSRFGNVATSFFFDAWGCSDFEDMPSELQVKWDFDGDGSWDSDYSHDKYATWKYDQPGIYHPKVRVMDTYGSFDEMELDIHVSPYHNPTSFLYDERSALYYGTVKIGNQWWMGENLRFNPNRDEIPGKFLTWCYDDNPTVCEATGKLYNAAQVLASWNNEWPEDQICPEGWRLPTADDWRELFQYQGIESAGVDLYYGGNTDFNALYGGYAGYHVYGPFTDFEMDSVYKTAVFMSSTLENRLRVFQLKRDSARAEERLMVVDGYYSIRCIKQNE